MSTASTSAAAGQSQTGRASEFDGCVPQSVEAINVMSKVEVAKKWDLLYRAADISSSGEQVKKSFRCAIYCYLAINGTSPVGEYTGTVISGRGTSMSATEIPTAVGRYDVRRFARANAEETVRFMHATDVLMSIPAILAKCEMMEIRVSEAIALCDWVEGAAGLTPAEREVQKGIRVYSLKRARGARGGKTVEDIRSDHMDEAVGAQYAPRVLPPGDSW